MNFKPLHIHKTRKESSENIIFLLIPILLFVLTLLWFTLKVPFKKVAGVSTENPLTEESRK